MAFIHHLVNGTKSTLLDVLGLLLNGAIFYGMSQGLISARYSDEWVAVITLGLAIFYCLHVRLFLEKKLVDRNLLFTFAGLSAFFLTVTMPLVLSREWITVSWALQALVLLWIAGKGGLLAKFAANSSAWPLICFTAWFFTVMRFWIFRVIFPEIRYRRI